MKVFADDGRLLDAELDIEPTAVGCIIVVHANGGASRGRPPRNPDYIPALERLLARLRDMDAQLDGLWVDSKTVAHLSPVEREIHPGGRRCPIRLRSVPDLLLFRLEIRRGVSRIGGQTIDTVGTGNKRVRLQLRLPQMARDWQAALVGPPASAAAGYWLETTAKDLSGGKRRTVSVELGVPVSTGHLVARLWVAATAETHPREWTASPIACDIWYVERVVSGNEPRGSGTHHGKVLKLVRMTEHSVIAPSLDGDGIDGMSSHEFGSWHVISEAALISIAERLGVSLDDLPIPIRLPVAPKSLASLWRTVRLAAPAVRERVSRYVERGRAGEIVKIGNDFRCQICEALGLPAEGFRKSDGTLFVEAHHVVPVSTLRDDVLGPENVIAVCPNHHRQLHLGGAVQSDEGDYFRLDFPFGQPTVWVKKFVRPAPPR